MIGNRLAAPNASTRINSADVFDMIKTGSSIGTPTVTGVAARQLSELRAVASDFPGSI